jgi:uncharacterized membrane protein
MIVVYVVAAALAVFLSIVGGYVFVGARNIKKNGHPGIV